MSETLQADDVMHVLPDDAGDRARAHEAHDDNSFTLHLEFLDRDSRISSHDGIGLDRFGDNRPGSDHGVISDGHAFQDGRVHSDPDVVADDDRRSHDFRARWPALVKRRQRLGVD